MRRATVATALLASAAVLPALPAVASRALTNQVEPLAWLHVDHPPGAPPVLVDSAGRTVILRGANLRGIEDDFYPVPGGGEPGPAPQYPIDPAEYQGTCPPAYPGAGEPPICEVQANLPPLRQSSSIGSEDDLAEIRAQGFDFVRLTISWSQLEPTPGVYSQTYLDRIAQVVGWAKQQGVYVLIDMHQDDYSRFIPGASESPNHADGAPAWAVMTSGLPGTSLAGQGELSLAVEAAFNAFWLNRVPPGVAQGAAPGPGLQDHYIGAMAAIVKRFRDDSTVVGYEIMNEPLPGFIPPVAFSTTNLYPFYRKVIDALTGTRDGAYRDLGIHATKQSFFFEPMAIRNLEDAPDQVALPFTSYPNIVYAPHDYTHVFTVDRLIGLSPSTSPYPLSYDQPYDVAGGEARLFGAALVCGEYGEFSGDPATYDEVITGMTAAQDRHLVGSTYWAWTGQAVSPLLTRAYPRATAGVLDSFSFDPTRRSFDMKASASRAVAVGDRLAETEVVIPEDVRGAVRVTGAAVLDAVVSLPDGTRRAYVAPSGGGPYSVAVG